jgi:hypothetical protein
MRPSNGVADSLACLELLFLLKEGCVLEMMVLDRGHSALVVPLAEYLGEMHHAGAAERHAAAELGTRNDSTSRSTPQMRSITSTSTVR